MYILLYGSGWIPKIASGTSIQVTCELYCF